MYIETKYELIALSEAKRMFDANERIFYRTRHEYRPILENKLVVAGNVYKEVFVEHPNEFRHRSLIVEKFKDGRHEFTVCEDYDVYTAYMDTAYDAKELAKFLLSEYVEEQ